MKKKLSNLICALTLCAILPVDAAENRESRWEITPAGGIQWTIDERVPHDDHIEMSGEQVSVVLRYGVNDKGAFELERSMIWPMLRTIPNNTHGSLMQRFAANVPSALIINGLTIRTETVKSIALDGKMTIKSEYGIGYVNVGSARKQAPVNVVEVTTTLFPSVDLPMLCERYEVKNIITRPISVLVPDQRAVYQTVASKGVDGSYTMVNSIQNSGTYTIQPGESITFGATVQAFKNGQSELTANVDDELGKRKAYVNEVWSSLKLETPDTTLNTAFAFAKIRASESIFKTKGGYMHGPGGESYYAAVWANDQAEYVNPFFPYLGYETGNKSVLNSFKHFARFVNADYKPIPSSIVAEGDDIWNGVGDRGDAAMIAYGASRYALARGDKQEAEQLWPLIQWCLEYCKRNLNDEGVVSSNTDELEFRFPAGTANLCTSTLYYDALLSAGYLGKSLGKTSVKPISYHEQAAQLKKNIESYFGAKVEGFDTYKYYKENDVLRSWICMPLTVGIYDRADETINALFSPLLWTKDGLLTQSGSETFWDRSTLYALRGIFEAGATDKAVEYFKFYSTQRLLGEHVPYPIEAWPEGSQRHLSAESGLYCRIVTEGLFGIRPTGLNSFSLTPRLPGEWNDMALRSIKAFGSSFDIEMTRKGKKIEVRVSTPQKTVYRKTVDAGKEISINI